MDNGKIKIETSGPSTTILTLLKRVAYVIITLILIIIVAKNFILEPFEIPSESMEDTLNSGNIILVNKLAYLFGKQPKSGNVVVLNDTIDHFIIKRCLASGGDNLQGIDGEVYINDKHYINPGTVKMKYQLRLSKDNGFYHYIDDQKITNAVHRDSANVFTGVINQTEKERLKRFKYLTGIQKIKNVSKSNLFFGDVNQSWDADNFGPFVIPRKGLTVTLNEQSYKIYGATIQRFEGIVITRKNKNYLVGGQKVLSYTFKNDYLFVLGDNRENSLDSRFVGFLPVREVVGKAVLILLPYDDGKFVWSKFLSAIN